MELCIKENLRKCDLKLSGFLVVTNAFPPLRRLISSFDALNQGNGAALLSSVDSLDKNKQCKSENNYAKIARAASLVLANMPEDFRDMKSTCKEVKIL